MESEELLDFPADNTVKYPSSYWRMCIGALLFFLSFHIIIPELYVHLEDLHAGELKGWLIGAFALASLLARPFSGWFADNVGRRITMLIGIACAILAASGYFIAFVPALFIAIRALHGLSAGFTPTGFTAFTTDVVHISKRGRAMGWQGLFSNIGSAAGYGLGGVLAANIGRGGVYLSGLILAILSFCFFLTLPETRPKNHQKNTFHFSIKKLIYTPAWKPAVIMLCICIPYGLMIPISQEYSQYLHFQNQGLFFMISIAVSLFIRIPAGLVTDKIGRNTGATIGVGFQFLGMLLLLFNLSVLHFYLAAISYGIGQGFTAPSLYSWAGDIGKTNYRGRAISTLFIALELGIVLGGFLLKDNLIGESKFQYYFTLCSVFTGAGFLFSLGSQIFTVRNPSK